MVHVFFFSFRFSESTGLRDTSDRRRCYSWWWEIYAKFYAAHFASLALVCVGLVHFAERMPPRCSTSPNQPLVNFAERNASTPTYFPYPPLPSTVAPAIIFGRRVNPLKRADVSSLPRRVPVFLIQLGPVRSGQKYDDGL